MIRIEAECNGMPWLEDLIAMGQESGSRPRSMPLKREDEKFRDRGGLCRADFCRGRGPQRGPAAGGPSQGRRVPGGSGILRVHPQPQRLRPHRPDEGLTPPAPRLEEENGRCLMIENVQALQAIGVSQQVAANNVANMNTDGFQPSRVDLETGPGGQGVRGRDVVEISSAGQQAATEELPPDEAALEPFRHRSGYGNDPDDRKRTRLCRQCRGHPHRCRNGRSGDRHDGLSGSGA